MNLTMYLKGENGKITPSHSYEFTEEEAKRLVDDFSAYVSPRAGTPRGGVYKCSWNPNGTPHARFLCLSFNEVAYIG